ncbi:MAG: OsmC family protein [Candidatus Margulisbacteria bacterium]|nr:OsmC family protein [Candidatus Margulisiibacteriota bacterium]
MTTHMATIKWNRIKDELFVDNKFSRGHEWIFDSGTVVEASSSPHIVPIPYSVESNVDPEEAFIASVSSCHMLFFLSISAKKGYVIDQYIDKAKGEMGKNSEGHHSIVKVKLYPRAIFSGDKKPTADEIQSIHAQSHRQCFIANSVKSEVEIKLD